MHLLQHALPACLREPMHECVDSLGGFSHVSALTTGVQHPWSEMRLIATFSALGATDVMILYVQHVARQETCEEGAYNVRPFRIQRR